MKDIDTDTPASNRGGEPAANDGEWAAELAELATRREQAAAMGGPEALAKFKARGRFNARERIDMLFDAGSFRELGRITGKGSSLQIVQNHRRVRHDR